MQTPLVYSCSASPSTVSAGDPVTVTGTAAGASARKKSVYTWISKSGQISGENNTVSVATVGLDPGEYAIAGRFSQGDRSEDSATCEAVFTIRKPAPPTISCSANPISISPGSTATISSSAYSPANRPLSFSYSASSGEIAGTKSIATLSTGNAPPGPIQVECSVRDDLGQSATASVTVNVAVPIPPLAERHTLCTLSFSRDTRRPVRVDNEAKAHLDDVALMLNRETGARLEITGERSADENLSAAAARALNARLYLTEEKGIAVARIDIRTGYRVVRAAEVELLPIGTPVHYSESPLRTQPRVPATSNTIPEAPSVPATIEVPFAKQAATPGFDAQGRSGRLRSPDSLVLPPLPEDTISGDEADAAPSQRHHRQARSGRSATPLNPR